MTTRNSWITRDEIHNVAKEVAEGFQARAEEGARSIAPIMIGGAFVLLYAVYRVGRRAGAASSTIVDIRRI